MTKTTSDTLTLPPAAAPAPLPQAGHATDAVPPAVQFTNVTKRYGAVVALADLDLELRPGSTVALLGPNGAGKSTAIGLMLGLLRPDEGEVRVFGASASTAVLAGRVGGMLQESGLPVGVTVAELIDFVRRLYPHPLPRDEVLSRAGLTGLAARRVERLSGGETQRVRFALAIAGDPELVFLDEPTVAMDVETRRAFWRDIRRFAAEGRTVLFATHYLDEADQVADRIVVLDHGRSVADGPPTSIKAMASGRRVRFTLPGADAARLRALPGVTDVAIHGDGVTLRSADTDATVRACFRADLPFRDLEVTGLDLEAAFLHLTGGSEDADAADINPRSLQ
ncbi:MAG TPA: ABC transporter ATP-binding protein [Candidatus Limnocylindrales bacterium]|jgi:ABC-2 type transport system ATP-binding protein|nr:ABC transporter ATP-binding protein [Candidatus Limnocylindrales bacterium]